MTTVVIRDPSPARRRPLDVDVLRAGIGIICVLVLFIVTGCRRSETSGVPSAALLDANATLPDDRFVLTAPLPASAITGGMCSIDAVDSQPSERETVNVETGQPMRISGWIATPDRSPPKSFRVTLKGNANYSASATAGESRPDVALALKADALANAGFTLIARTDGVAPGGYQVILAQQHEGRWQQCNSTSRIQVVASPR